MERTLKSQEESLTRKLRGICRKHNIFELTCSRTTFGGKMGVGNFILEAMPSFKMVRRLKNALPEMRKQLEKTATCCEWRGGLDFEDLEEFITKNTKREN